MPMFVMHDPLQTTYSKLPDLLQNSIVFNNVCSYVITFMKSDYLIFNVGVWNPKFKYILRNEYTDICKLLSEFYRTVWSSENNNVSTTEWPNIKCSGRFISQSCIL